MSKLLAQNILRNIKNIPGWRTDRRIVVIESDDWGSIRMPSLDVYHSFIKKGFPVDKGLYNRYDSLETPSDLSCLFELLMSVKDIHANPALFTANCIVANPDFEKIRQADFSQYHYELVTETIRKYPGREGVIALWKEGMENKIFKLQSHGREHVNIERWMKMLKRKDPHTLYCFDHHTTFSGNGVEDYNFMEALDYDDIAEIDNISHILEDGLRIFRELAGYSSKSFIAPSYIWHSGIEPALNKGGVNYLQGLQFQFIPKLKFGDYKKEFHYLGEMNQLKQRFLIRNCSFEPSITPNMDAVDYCLNQIEIAFRWKKPAVITSHRVNYIGCLDEGNRTRSLALLKKLLFAIQKKWPNVEFMSSDQLGDLISSR